MQEMGPLGKSHFFFKFVKRDHCAPWR